MIKRVMHRIPELHTQGCLMNDAVDKLYVVVLAALYFLGFLGN